MDWLNDGIAVNNPDILSNGVDLGFSVGMTCCQLISGHLFYGDRRVAEFIGADGDAGALPPAQG